MVGRSGIRVHRISYAYSKYSTSKNNYKFDGLFNLARSRRGVRLHILRSRYHFPLITLYSLPKRPAERDRVASRARTVLYRGVTTVTFK